MYVTVCTEEKLGNSWELVLLPCGIWGSKAGHQAHKQALQPTEPSYQP